METAEASLGSPAPREVLREGGGGDGIERHLRTELEGLSPKGAGGNQERVERHRRSLGSQPARG